MWGGPIGLLAVWPRQRERARLDGSHGIDARDVSLSLFLLLLYALAWLITSLSRLFVLVALFFLQITQAQTLNTHAHSPL